MIPGLMIAINQMAWITWHELNRAAAFFERTRTIPDLDAEYREVCAMLEYHFKYQAQALKDRSGPVLVDIDMSREAEPWNGFYQVQFLGYNTHPTDHVKEDN